MASFYNHFYPRYYNPYWRNQAHSNINSEDKHTYEKEYTTYEDNSTYKNQEKSSRYYGFGPIHFKNPLFCDIEEPIFDVLGISLYLDDIIILGLLFLLYQEGVHDEMLYIVLILLLLS